MTKEPKVLVGITTYEAKDYIFHKCLEYVRALDYSNFDVAIVDNTKDIEYFLKLKRMGYTGLYRVERGKTSREALTKSQNRLRQLCLAGNYDYLLLVESDLLIPKDSIKRLLSYNKQVVGSTYFLTVGTGTDSKPLQAPCIFMDDVMEHGLGSTRLVGIRKRPDGKKVYAPKEIEDILNTGLVRCHGCGFGCTLLTRDIVERFPFWCDERLQDKHSDVYFYLDLLTQQVPVYVDTDIIVPHFPSKWDAVQDR